MRASSRGRDRQRGSASIELVGLVPLVLVVLLAAAQVMTYALSAHAASQAARDGARAYSLDESPGAAARASLPGGVELVDVSTYGPDHGVRVTVQAPKVLFVTDRRITRAVTMP
jgi:hypothetical protein